MKKFFIKGLVFCLFGTVFFCCAPDKEEMRPDFKKYFHTNGYTGSFVLYDLKNDRKVYYDKVRCRNRYCPASTFKIFNALVGLETGVIKGEDDVRQWDSIVRDVPDWNQDLSLKDAFGYSAVWYFQQVAREIGSEKMQEFITKAEYGNQDISGRIDTFWLDGGLRISQEEQIFFLRKLYERKLPFSERSMNIVKDIMITEKNDSYVFRSKTGSALKSGIGWHVGYVEKDDNVYFFATNIFGNPYNRRFHFARIRITHQILKDLEILE